MYFNFDKFFIEKATMNESMEKKDSIFITFISLGILIRFFVMALGHNYDFDSYCIVGEIAGHSRNVYAETARYNYGPVFLCIQGLLYRISQIDAENWKSIYRILIVSLLTLTDLEITNFIASRYSLKKGIIFFLNPVSIIITGYHNQFDNIAVLIALLTIFFYNEEQKFNRKDIVFVTLFTLSLMTKHILFMSPFFILLKKGLPFKKKVIYAVLPPSLFLLSFIPFATKNTDACQGILSHVFLYRSFNNAPLFNFLYNFIGFPQNAKIIVYAACMILTALVCRKYTYEHQLLIYLISMVAFSSAIANQYLVIPLAALCILEVGIWKYIYMVTVGGYLFLHKEGLRMLYILLENCLPIKTYATNFLSIGYNLAAWILFLTLLYLESKKFYHKK